MTDRPILFSGPMIKALLAGRKTQTRRIMKPQPQYGDELRGIYAPGLSAVFGDPDNPHEDDLSIRLFSLGDRLWVREAWRTSHYYDDLPPRDLQDGTPVKYEADGVWQNWGYKADSPRNCRLRASMHMPRWVSRLTLVVTDVRVHRIQDISNGDAAAEGVSEHEEIVDIKTTPSGHPVEIHDYRYRVEGIGDDDEGYLDEWSAFRNLWITINGEESWDQDPWVVAYTFEVHHTNIDQMEQAA